MRILLALVGIGTILFLLLPVLAVIPMSFNDSTRFEIIPSNPSLRQYREFVSDQRWMESFWLSVKVASIVMLSATVLGTLAAMGITRLPARLRGITEAVFMSPQIVPSVVIAASAYFIFVELRMVGTVAGIAVMHTVVALPFVVVMMGSRLQSLSPDLAQASANLGAQPWQTFWRVTLPQISTALVGGALLAFHVSFDEVILALFLSGARNKTLPVRLWDGILFEVTPILPAISTVVMIVPVMGLVVLFMFQRWRATGG
ncbi:ABC transporter permease [Bradyrhizobium sp. NC92]|uniref:ABC transporter permease n=1 Tax=Bradyrhizobium sp. (strain NC92) TaxID=55395 RepID=UPI0021AA37BD|nr:ABC transporter permease [Bradyrhizobium sp. NC92]UWU67974.1 ABC transporter permease [Bradyrhizobium sp. NC92]